jgi:hypothetical protein
MPLVYYPQTLLTQVYLQSAQPVKAGGAAGNKSKSCARICFGFAACSLLDALCIMGIRNFT